MPCPPWGTAPEDDIVADVSSLSWVNVLLGCLWPAANTAVTKHVYDELIPRLQETLPGPLKHFRFSRFSLGKTSPEFGPIEVVRHTNEHIQIELDMRYLSDVDILVDSGGISFGVNQLTFHGRLCIAMKPLIAKWPVICGVQVFFANQPKVELRFAGLAHLVNEFPGIAQKVKGTVDDFFRNSIVLPNLKSIRLTQDDEALDLTQASSHPALGVMRVRVVCAKNLAGANWNLRGSGQLSSDPFCVLRLGHREHRTSTVFGATSPTWPAGEPSAYFVVYHQEQELTVDVETQDRRGLFQRNFLNHLGRTKPLSVRTLMYRSEAKAGGDAQHAGVTRRRREMLDISQVKSGMLHMDDPVNHGVPSEVELEVEWFELALGASSPFARGSRGLVFVELHAGSGFPARVVQNRKRLRWRCRLAEGDPICSRPGELVHNDPTFGLPIHPRVLRVIEELFKREIPVADIADIVDADPKSVAQWIQLREDAHAHEMEKQRQITGLELGATPCIEMRWHETLPLLVRRPQESYLAIELLEGDDRLVGQLDPIALQPLLVAGGGSLARETLRLLPSEQSHSSVGGLSAWLFPVCSKPQVTVGGYSQVRMDVSVRLQVLEASSGPRAVGRGSIAGGPACSESTSDACSTVALGAHAASSSGPGSTSASRSGQTGSLRSGTPPPVSAGVRDDTASTQVASRRHTAPVSPPPATLLAGAAACPSAGQVASASGPQVTYGSVVPPPSLRLAAETQWQQGARSPCGASGPAHRPLSPRVTRDPSCAGSSRGKSPTAASTASGGANAGMRRGPSTRQPHDGPGSAPSPPPAEQPPWNDPPCRGPPAPLQPHLAPPRQPPVNAHVQPVGPVNAGQPMSMVGMPGAG